MKKFLIAHPDHFIQRALDVTLRDLHFATAHAHDGLDAIDQALDGAPDAIILGTSLSGLGGLDVARALRALSSTRRIPILFVTSDARDTSIVKQSALPLIDWVEAPLELTRVREHLFRLANAMPSPPAGEGSETTQELAAISDPVTGLYGRQYMLHRLTYEAARAARYGHDLATVLLGIHGMDEIKMRHGPGGADSVAIGLANLLRRKLRVVDLVGRTAADEFLIIAPHTDSTGANSLANRLDLAIREARFDVEGSKEQVHIAIGVAVSSGNSLSDNLALFARAEAALANARQDGSPSIVSG